MKVAFYRASKGTLLDKIINLWTGSYGYSHVELVFDELYEMNGSKSMCFSASPREGKTRFKYIDLNDGKWEVYTITDGYVPEVEAFHRAKKIENKKYDYYGIFFWFVFSFVKKQKNNEWWCSEACPWCLKWTRFRLSPNKFAKLLGVEHG